MPQRRAGVEARIRNFGHETRPSKKARTSQSADKENASSQLLSRSRGKSSKFGQLRQPLLVHANGPNVTIRVPRPYIEEVEDDDSAPNIDPLPFDPDGPIMIPVLSSIPGCALDNDGDEVEDGGAGDGDGNEGDSDSDISEVDSDDLPHQDHSWEARQPPTIEAACKALADINRMLKPPRPKGGGYKECKLPLQL